MSCVHCCRRGETKEVCSECFAPFCGENCFIASRHALICAAGKRPSAEVSDEQVLQWFQEDNVDKIRELLVEERMPTNLRSLRYARSIEMATLLKGDPFEYIGDGKIALDECMKYFNVRPLLPRSEDEELVVDIVKKIQKVRDNHLVLCPEIKIEIVIKKLENEKYTFTGQMLTETLKKMHRDPKGFLEQDAGKEPYLVELANDVDMDELYKQLIFEGFFPDVTESFDVAVDDSDEIEPDSFKTSEIAKYVEDNYLKRYDKRTLTFWFGVKFLQVRFEKWLYFSENALERRAQETPESFSLVVNGHFNKVFEHSRRAKTQMQLFRTVNSKTLHHVPAANTMIRVTRYAEGMKGGLFHNDPGAESKSYCGTFYYHEPDSNVFLQYKKKLVAKDKREAAEKLGIHSMFRKHWKHDNESDEEYRLRMEIDREKALRLALENKGTESLMFTPRELINFVKNNDITHHNPRFNYIINGPASRLINMQHQRKYYCGHVLMLYALQDFLDQPICTAAYKQGYDIVVLTHMVGSRQMVTEVLDVRSREESFANLHYLV